MTSETIDRAAGGGWRHLPSWQPVARTERLLVWSIVGLGVLGRILFFTFAPWQSGGGEAERVAVAIATGHGFADAYFVGSGPTAHLTPTTPVLAGLVYRLLGVHSPAAGVTLIAWSLACFAGSALLLNRLFERLGCALPERLLALAVMCFAPVFLVHETIVFQFWEGQITFILLLLSLLHAIRDLTAVPGTRRAWHAALLNAATMLINPICGLAAIGSQLSVFATRRLWARAVLHLALVVALVVPPVALWAMRNAAVIGSPVLFRDNLGMELSFKANDDVLRRGPDMDVVGAKWTELHPDGNGFGMRQIRRWGEHNYMVMLQQRAVAWIMDHPVGFGWIVMQGWVAFFFPSPLNFSVGTALPRTLMIWSIDAVGLAALLWATVRRRPGWLQIALVVVAISAAYAPFIYLWRYQYQVYNLLLFAAAWGAMSGLRRLEEVRARGEDRG